MKVHSDRPGNAKAAWRACTLVLASALVAIVGLFPAPASAITRSTILTRAHHWVTKKVHYSQSKYYGGYRRDCSGFVSMAWKLGRSYTSSTIHKVARHVPLKRLLPGDSVHTPGHVTIFVAWANRARTRYVAMEESTWGKPARHHVRSLGRHATGLRYRHLTTPAPRPVAAKPAPGVVPSSAGTPSVTPTASPDATSAAAVTAGALVSSLDETVAPAVFEDRSGPLVVVPFRYSPAAAELSSIHVATLREPSWMTGYLGGGKSSSRWSYVYVRLRNPATA